MSVLEVLRKLSETPFEAPAVPEDIPHGDMPGDKVHVDQNHIQKVTTLFPKLLPELCRVMEQSPCEKAVITVCGGSGVGKSESASVLAYFLNSFGIGAYVLSGDNYPRRIPMYNDAERLSIFRSAGMKALADEGRLTSEISEAIRAFQKEEQDADPSLCANHPYMETYQKAGRFALKGYLGTEKEQGFEILSDILSRFKQGASEIYLKRMGRTDTELWYEKVDFSKIHVIVLEWTHGNSDGFTGVDIPVLLNSTPKETAVYRRLRARDGKTDSPFVSS